MALVAGGAASSQTGSAVAALALPILGIPAVVVVRQLVMALVHLPLSVRHLRAAPRRHLLWGVLVGLPMGAMNLSIYAAIRSMGVGLAVTVEFLGPLALSVIASRSRIGVACAIAGFAGMVCVTGPSGTATGPGTLFGLLAGLCWALYLTASQAAGRRLRGLAPSAIAAVTSVTLLLPVVILTLDPAQVRIRGIVFALLAGVLSSALPYGADVLALRRLPLSLVATLMSLHPGTAAIAGLIILGERLSLVDVIGLLLISAANAIAVRAARPRPGSGPDTIPVDAAAG